MAVHARGDVTGECLLPHAPQGFTDRYTQRFVQVGIRVCIDRENGCFSQINKRADQQGTDRGLAGPAFSGKGDGKGIFLHDMSCLILTQGHAPVPLSRIRREISAAAPMMAREPSRSANRIPQLGVIRDCASNRCSGMHAQSRVLIARYF